MEGLAGTSYASLPFCCVGTLFSRGHLGSKGQTVDSVASKTAI